jgi:hypothetical protein
MMAERIALVFILKETGKGQTAAPVLHDIPADHLQAAPGVRCDCLRTGSSHSGIDSNGAVLSPERNTTDVYLQSMAL